MNKLGDIRKVSLAFDRHVPVSVGGIPVAPEPMLEPAGPKLIMGGLNAELPLAQPIVPSHTSMFGPRGAVLVSSEGPLIVSDTGHHRLMVWNRVPDHDNAPCDFIIGQPDFDREGRNAKGEPDATTLNVPTGVVTDGKMLAVADAWNHRVLIWHSIPTEMNQPADIVLGQCDFSGMLANRGGEVGANTTNWCYGVAILDGNLLVADTGNRRVLMWKGIPTDTGQPADMVLGQDDFTTRDENAGRDPGPLGMRWPHSVVAMNGKLLVSDAGNNRIMVWDKWPDRPGVPCDYLLGQKDAQSLEHNRAAYLPDARALNMPYGVAVIDDWLIAADTANSRLVGWRADFLAPDAPANGVGAQPDFISKGDNRWSLPMRDSLCWPYWVSARGKTLVIADSGNNRVMLWDMVQ